MKIQWCWKCKRDVPMLDENEWAIVFALHMESVNSQKRHGHEDTPENKSVALDRYATFCLTLEGITGERSADPRTCIWHRHRIAARGAPCAQCGKVMRGPGASQCFECGWVSRLKNSRL